MSNFECKICGREFKNLNSFANHISRTEKITSKNYYDKYFKKEHEGICYCGKETKFFNMTKGYQQYCSKKCSSNSEINIEKKLKKYKQTCLNKYGKEHYTQTNECKDKIRKTNLKKYGETTNLKTDFCKQKIKETCLKKYGEEHYSKTNEYKEKVKNTSLKRYGKTSYTKTEECQNRKKQTFLKNYGVEHYSKTDEFKEKFKQTSNEKFGCDSPLQNEEIKEKSKETCLSKYGENNYAKTSEFKEKLKFISMKTYGVDHHTYSQEYKIKINKIFYNKLFNSDRLQDKIIPLFKLSEYKGTSIENKYLFKCNKCHNEFKDHLDNGRMPRCPICYPPNNVSLGEKEVCSFCQQYFPNLIENDRTQIYPLELDIYIPELSLAIEYNGLYWHSESQGKDSNYHLNKYLLCKEKNITLIQIFEDEWENKQEIVKSILLNKFNRLPDEINIDECVIKEIDINNSNLFLENNHISGQVNSKINIGLFYNNELISILTIDDSINKDYQYEIYRFCNKLNINIPGAFLKLFKYFKDKYLPKSVIVYSDLRYGNYDNYSDFIFSNISNPNFYYIKKNESNRYSDLKYINNDLSEYNMIWDCGNKVYEWSS